MIRVRIHLPLSLLLLVLIAVVLSRSDMRIRGGVFLLGLVITVVFRLGSSVGSPHSLAAFQFQQASRHFDKGGA
jgi:lipopolysaccharide export LptBFGC system permease protein LptF